MQKPIRLMKALHRWPQCLRSWGTVPLVPMVVARMTGPSPSAPRHLDCERSVLMKPSVLPRRILSVLAVVVERKTLADISHDSHPLSKKTQKNFCSLCNLYSFTDFEDFRGSAVDRFMIINSGVL